MLQPTKRADWVKVGDGCTALGGTMVGKVTRIVEQASVPYAVVQWPNAIGRHTITMLVRREASERRH